MQSRLTATIIGLVLLFGHSTEARSPIQPARAEYFPGTWQGYDDGHLSFIRMDLAVDGTGYLVMSELPNYPSDLYRIERWRQTSDGEWDLVLTIKPATKDSAIISTKNVHLAGSTAITLEVFGKSWKLKFTLFKKDVFEKRAAAADADLKKLFK